MKKHKYPKIFGLLVLLCLVLTGCGGGGNGGGGPTTSTIIFELPEYYEGRDQGGSYPIPEEKEVRFYTLSQPDFDETFLADYFFTGTTGSDEIKCILPDSLKGQARYICAVIFLEDEDSEDRFDPEEKSGQEIIEAIGEGKILLGFAVNPDENPKLHTFAHGVTIKDFIFTGKAEGDPTYTINFSLPAAYQDEAGNNYEVPEGKEVNLYATSVSGADVIDADHVFTGTTGGSISCEIPPVLVGEERYFYAVVILEGSFDLQGKTGEEVMTAVDEGKILFGRAMDPDNEGDMKLHNLVHGAFIGDFEFFGKGEGDPITTINIIMPAVYEDMEDEEKYYPIPSGKQVKFYVEPEYQEDEEEEDEDFIFYADHVFTETTGPAEFEFELPSFLVGEERDIAAIVVLEGTFDLEGKSELDLYMAVYNGMILFGQTDDFHTLNYGVSIDDFEFFGIAR